MRRRAVASAEIIDRKPDAEVLQAAQDSYRTLGIGEHVAFGDFERQPFGGERVAFQKPVDLIGEIGVEEIARRQVDRNAEWLVRARPDRGRLDPPFEGPARQRPDEPAAFSDRDELIRRQQIAVRPAPAGQSLDTGDLSGLQVHLWLHVQESCPEFKPDRSAPTSESRATDVPFSRSGRYISTDWPFRFASYIAALHAAAIRSRPYPRMEHARHRWTRPPP